MRDIIVTIENLKKISVRIVIIEIRFFGIRLDVIIMYIFTIMISLFNLHL